MADYRDWCGYCHNEINFGSHDPDCEYLHAERIAYKEVKDFEQELFKTYRAKSEEELLDEAEALYKEIVALGDVLAARERKWRFLNHDILTYRQRNALAERMGKKYLRV